MNLAFTIRVCLILSLSLGRASQASTSQSQSGTTPQTPQSQASEPAPTPPLQATPTPKAAQTKPPADRPKHRKKTPSSNCVTAASDPSKPNNAPTDAATTGASPAQTQPCPPKKVVRNGGSSEPSIQLSGGTAGEQALQQRSTEQLTTATEENLKQIAGRQLNPSQQEMVNQIKEFMGQSKSAIAAGDPERGHNLAEKAHLLSEELLKP